MGARSVLILDFGEEGRFVYYAQCDELQLILWFWKVEFLLCMVMLVSAVVRRSVDDLR